MIGKLIPYAVFAAIVGTALNAGMFYAFSSFIMPALARLPGAQGAEAMNAINVTVITPSFMLAFMGTAILCLALGGWSLTALGEPRGWLILAASVIFVIGCFGTTMALNVPLNNGLVAASGETLETLWRSYVPNWTLWNTVRTAASLIAMGVFVLALWRR